MRTMMSAAIGPEPTFIPSAPDDRFQRLAEFQLSRRIEIF